MTTNKKIAKWLEIGKRNPWIAQAYDPPFTAASFERCNSLDELRDNFLMGNWCSGTAFYYGDICFIEQGDGNNEWLTIKDDLPFESISWYSILKKPQGDKQFYADMEDLLCATPRECKNLEWSGASKRRKPRHLTIVKEEYHERLGYGTMG